MPHNHCNGNPVEPSIFLCLYSLLRSFYPPQKVSVFWIFRIALLYFFLTGWISICFFLLWVEHDYVFISLSNGSSRGITLPSPPLILSAQGCQHHPSSFCFKRLWPPAPVSANPFASPQQKRGLAVSRARLSYKQRSRNAIIIPIHNLLFSHPCHFSLYHHNAPLLPA